MTTAENYRYRNPLIQLRHPFTCLIAGASGSGKTHFLTNLLMYSDLLIDVPIQRLVYCYGAEIPATFKKLKSKFPFLEVYEGLNENLKFNSRINNFLIIDDLMTDSVKSNAISDYFTKGSHHSNLSVILLTQNFFQQGAYARTINTNANYVVYFKNPRDNLQIQYLGRQIYSGKSQILTESFKNATERPHGYIFLDFKQTTPDEYRLKTNILPSDPGRPLVYIPKNKVI